MIPHAERLDGRAGHFADSSATGSKSEYVRRGEPRSYRRGGVIYFPAWRGDAALAKFTRCGGVFDPVSRRGEVRLTGNGAQRCSDPRAVDITVEAGTVKARFSNPSPHSGLSFEDHRAKFHLRYFVPCKRCEACALRNRSSWISRMQCEFVQTHKAGLRTRFFTLTLSPDVTKHLIEIAQRKRESDNARRAARSQRRNLAPITAETVFKTEVANFVKRLRAAGCPVRYVFVIEQHKSGQPHAHGLLHEMHSPVTLTRFDEAWKLYWGRRIAKEQIRAKWTRDQFQQTQVVKANLGDEMKDARQAAFYVAKYISKERVSRVCASPFYGKGVPGETQACLGVPLPSDKEVVTSSGHSCDSNVNNDAQKGGAGGKIFTPCNNAEGVCVEDAWLNNPRYDPPERGERHSYGGVPFLGPNENLREVDRAPYKRDPFWDYP